MTRRTIAGIRWGDLPMPEPHEGRDILALWLVMAFLTVAVGGALVLTGICPPTKQKPPAPAPAEGMSR